MRTTTKFILGFTVFALMGQGCFSGGGSSTTANGGVWQTNDGGDSWTQITALPQASGVGSIAGVNVNDIEIDPSDDSAYYIGTSANGMFYTYDNGVSWQRPEDSAVKSGNILKVEVDARDVCTIYALKADRILKSTDCARTFDSIYVESRENEALTALVIDWFDPDVLWAGTSNGEVLKSVDAGASWKQIAVFKSDITAIEISNADSRYVLIGTESKGLYLQTPDSTEFIEYEKILKEYRNADDVYGFTQTANGSRILMNTKYGLLKSDDKGLTWAPIPLVTPPGDVRIWSTAIDPKNPETMYYATESIFYVSTSGGDSWEAIDMPSSRVGTAMEVHPTVTNVVIIGFTAMKD